MVQLDQNKTKSRAIEVSEMFRTALVLDYQKLKIWVTNHDKKYELRKDILKLMLNEY